MSQFDFLLWLIPINELEHIGHIPQGVGETYSHCRGHADGLMQASEVVPHEIDRERMTMIFQLLGKGIGQPGKSSECDV